VSDPASWILEVYPTLLKIVQKRLGCDPTTALDIVHDAILAIYDSMDRFDPEKGIFQAWAAGILRNLTYRHFERRGRREKLASEEELDDHEAHDGGPPIDDAIIQELAIVIQKSLESVPPIYREVVKLRYREGRSLKQIARALHLPLGTVKARLSRASDILKDALNFQQTTVRTFLDGHP
jgi:RNA polymerase sigma-70 factor (ECF subfamily)